MRTLATLKKKKTVDFLGLSRYALEIPDKMKLRPSTLEKFCYTPCNFQDQRPILSSAPLVMPILFLIDLWNFRNIIFHYTPKKFQVFNPPPLFAIFSEVVPIAMPLL